MQYACKAGIRGGVARCRNLTPCSTHPDGQPPAPRPDVVLVKVNLSDRWVGEFTKAGIRRLDRSPERAAALAAEHRASAEALGRDAFAIRESRDGKADDPESADSGCPVFGRDGLQSASIVGLAEELEKGEFKLSGIPHILARQWKPPQRLVLQFARGQPEVGFAWPLFRQLIATCFGQVDVWANGRDDRGLVVHTVNCGKRNDAGKPAYVLRFTAGDWVAEPLA